MAFSNWIRNLNNYSTRYEIFRLAAYGTLALSDPRRGLNSMANREAASRLSSKLFETMTVLRLLDDLPMLAYTCHYGLGSQVSESTVLKVAIPLNWPLFSIHKQAFSTFSITFARIKEIQQTPLNSHLGMALLSEVFYIILQFQTTLDLLSSVSY